MTTGHGPESEVGRLEAAFGNHEVSYQTLVEQAPVVCYVASAKDPVNTIYVAPKVEALLGYAPDEWTGESGFFGKCLHPDDTDRVRKAIAARMVEGEVIDL